MSEALKSQIRQEAAAAGFDGVAVTTVDAVPQAAARLAAYLDAGHHGDMTWMAEHAARRKSPAALWPDAKTVVMLAKSYAPESDPIATKQPADRAVISAYARGKDYHDIVKSGLKRVARVLQTASGGDVKVFVDTAPLMEKPLAEAAGLGWQGKHTNLVSRTHGSWLFLGAILTTVEIEPDPREVDHCGSCTRCLDACPTNAFPSPYTLDARRCIAYLTIEHKGHIAEEFRTAIGNRVFGCDDCLAVCPWNKFAQVTREQRFLARAETDNPPTADLLALDDAAFRSRFAGTPVKRTGRDRVVRNALIAAGNSGDATLAEPVEHLIDDTSPLVRAMAVWALARIAPDRLRALGGKAKDEHDDAVRKEWTAALTR
jgi:epoxyqueuosine reductase